MEAGNSEPILNDWNSTHVMSPIKIALIQMAL
jgi:hypothetical protein